MTKLILIALSAVLSFQSAPVLAEPEYSQSLTGDGESSREETIEHTLSPRSTRALLELRGLIQHAEVLNALTALAPFATLMGNPAQATLEISNTDWALWGRAVVGMPNWQRRHLYNFCSFEAVSQSTSRNDYRFWKRMAESFK